MPGSVSAPCRYPSMFVTHFTVGNRQRQIDNYATFHNTSGGLPNNGGANLVYLDGHVDFLRRGNNLDDGFRLAWPKKELPCKAAGGVERQPVLRDPGYQR